jgi:hypothetical protein
LDAEGNPVAKATAGKPSKGTATKTSSVKSQGKPETTGMAAQATADRVADHSTKPAGEAEQTADATEPAPKADQAHKPSGAEAPAPAPDEGDEKAAASE